MRKYKLLKDLPCAEAGEIFQQGFDENDKDNIYLFQEILGIKQIKILLDYIDDFDEWFEEIEDVKVPDEFYIIGFYADKRGIETFKFDNKEYMYKTVFLNNSEIGTVFKTREEAEKYIEYLKAKEIIKQDTKGFKPDWKNKTQAKYFGCWGSLMERKRFDYEYIFKNSEIYFQSEEDIKESFKKHPKEWKAYLTYEQ